MKKLITTEPGKLEEIVIVTFFILFFVLTIVAESTSQVVIYSNANQPVSNVRAK